ncbi:hypothetical protein D3C72_1778430 [compost metagenome]
MQANHAAQRVADEITAFDTERTQQLRYFIRHIGHAIAVRYHAFAAAGAIVIVNDHPEMPG